MNSANPRGPCNISPNGPVPLHLHQLHLQLQQQQMLARHQRGLQWQLLLRQQELDRQQFMVHQQQLEFQWRQSQMQLQPQEASDGGAKWPEDRKPRNPTSPAMRNAKGEVIDPCSWEDKPTTVMVRGLPRHYTQRQLLEMVDLLGFGVFFDFLYLPWDIKYDRNARGIGFLNFREAEFAMMFREACKRHQVEGKTIQVHPARLQGFKANYDHFQKHKIGQHPAHRPIFITGPPDW